LRKKFFTYLEIKKIINNHKKNNQKIIWTNGCFDIIHYGHIDYLIKSKNKGDYLIVGINSDKSVKLNKGPERPFFKLKYRIKVLEAIECVDYIVSYDTKTPYNAIKTIRPDYIAKGGDYKKEDVVGIDLVKEVFIIPYIKGFSTTNILSKIEN
jgi:rfaE bifunctional protein nucleotidyltransferase chain/domain